LLPSRQHIDGERMSGQEALWSGVQERRPEKAADLDENKCSGLGLKVYLLKHFLPLVIMSTQSRKGDTKKIAEKTIQLVVEILGCSLGLDHG
jgi:hypothetical protein